MKIPAMQMNINTSIVQACYFAVMVQQTAFMRAHKEHDVAYHIHHMFSLYGMDQKRAQKGLAQPQAWYTGDVSASPERGKACELAEVTRARQAKHLSAHTRT